MALARPLPPGSALPIALRMFPKARVVSIDHHAAHAAAAYLTSPFENAAVITLDREGDLRCGSKWRGEGNRLSLEEEILYPDSIGELYGRVTELLGFQRRADEHRVQWLSATGEPRYQKVFAVDRPRSCDRPVVLRFRSPGSRRIRRKVFRRDRHRWPRRIQARERADIAASMQKTLEDYVLRLAGDAENVCLGGGVAWNALLVSALERSGRFKGVFAQPAAGNAGTALGAALSVWSELLGRDAQRSTAAATASAHPSARAEIKQVLENCKLRFKVLATTPEMIGAAVDQLKENRIVAWMQGRMEFGPRALGNRSILASPQDPYSTENLNAFIKHREARAEVRGVRAGRACLRIFRSGTQRAPSRHREPRPRGIQRAVPRARFWRTIWSACTPCRRKTILSTGNCCTRSERRPACRFSTTHHSIFSASRWYARRAMPCGAFIPRASTQWW